MAQRLRRPRWRIQTLMFVVALVAVLGALIRLALSLGGPWLTVVIGDLPALAVWSLIAYAYVTRHRSPRPMGRFWSGFLAGGAVAIAGPIALFAAFPVLLDAVNTALAEAFFRSMAALGVLRSAPLSPWQLPLIVVLSIATMCSAFTVPALVAAWGVGRLCAREASRAVGIDDEAPSTSEL